VPPHLRNGQVNTNPQQHHQQLPPQAQQQQQQQQNFNNNYSHAPANVGMQNQNGAGAQPYYGSSN
jgi:hypothetical protein